MTREDHEYAHRNDIPLPAIPIAYRWRDDRVVHRETCTAVVFPGGGEIRCFRFDYQLEYWLYAGSLELCPVCKPGEFP